MIDTIEFSDRVRFARSVIEAEQRLVDESRIRESLRRVAGSLNGVRAFAAAFYFIRSNFVRHNFILGSRLDRHERMWAPIVKNLVEELGGAEGTQPTHNELYRRFLESFGLNEAELAPDPFAVSFDEMWTSFVRDAEIKEALLALGVYELLDGPDYSFMRDELRAGKATSECALEFFEVHSEVRHFEMFEDAFEDIFADEASLEKLRRATVFVLETQKTMWQHLASHLDAVGLH